MNVVILAAGAGKRMRSRLPKVLHPIAGQPMLARVVATARQLADARLVVVVGHRGDEVRAALDAPDLRWAVQDPQQGTGDAVRRAEPLLGDDALTMILYGDVPLTRIETLRALSAAAAEGSPGRVAILTVTAEDPTGYGRIVRAEGRIVAIVEEKDASEAERGIREVNTGILVAPTAHLKDWLARLTNDNAQREYYLTDIVRLAVADGVAVTSVAPTFAWETTGVNDPSQLAALERRFQRAIADELLRSGVSIADRARLDVRGTLDCGSDVTIDVGCVFEGHVALGDGTTVGPYAVVRNARIGARTRIHAFCHIDGGSGDGNTTRLLVIGDDAVVGPYARLRPDTTLADGVHIGNFVEVKASQLGAGSKANHLSYLGDATIGAHVNVGAGTITCNYDGAAKHRTTIEDDVHVGSDVQLVAPVTIGRGATIGAGTTVWKDVPPDALVVNPKTQVVRPDWRRPIKKK